LLKRVCLASLAFFAITGSGRGGRALDLPRMATALPPGFDLIDRNHGIPVRSDSAELFRRHCVACHGKGGEGNGPVAAALSPRPANLTDTTLMNSLTDDELLTIIAKGRRTMPAFGTLLKPEELAALAAYVRSLSAKP